MSLSADVDVRVYNASGRRVHFPQQYLTEISFDIGERGGCLTGSITTELEWQNFVLTGQEYVDIRLWGSSQVLFRGWARQPQSELKTPESVTLSLFGLMTLLNGYQCRRDYTFAAADIGDVFTAVANDLVVRPGRWPGLVLDTSGVSVLGISVDVFNASGNNFSDAMNALCDLAPGQLVWGCDVDGAGNNRLYLRPRADAVSSSPIVSYGVGGKVTAFVYPRDANQVVNRIFVTGGKIVAPNLPNLVNNPSFETPTQPGETTSNLLENPSFEMINGVAPTLPVFWQVTGSPNPSLAQGNGRTGQNALNLPPGSTISQQVMVPSTLPVPISQACWANIPPGGTGILYMILTAYNSAGTVIGSYNPGAYTFAASSVGAYVYQHFMQTWTPPVGTAWLVAQVAADSSSSTGMNLDDVAVWTEAPTNQGWALGIPSNAYCLAIDWAHGREDVPNSPPPFEPGCTMLKIEAIITGGAGSFLELTSTVDSRPSINTYSTYTALFRVAADARGPAIGCYPVVRVWGNDNKLQITVGPGFPAGTGTPIPTMIPPDGQWHTVAYQFTVSGTSASIDMVLRIASSGTLYVDAAQLIRGAWGGAFGQTLYTNDDTYRGTRDVMSADVSGSLTPDAAGSITDWGERESQVSNDNVVDEATMTAFAISYLQAHATPAVQARLTVDGADAPLPIGSLARLLNLPGAPPPLPIAKVSYRIGNTIVLDADLNNERPDQAVLLRRIQSSGIGGVPWP
jgi:hypothetical protein